MLRQIEFNIYEHLHDYVDYFEPHSDEVITSDQGYIDVAQQIESMMLAGQLLQESRPNTRNLVFDYEDDDTAFNDFSDVSAVDRRGSDIVDVYFEADNLNQRIYQAKVDQAKVDQAKADQSKADQADVVQAKVGVSSNE